MTGIYALVSPDGILEFRDGVPDQMCKDADPQNGVPSAFPIQRASWGGHGLHGHVANASALNRDAYPPSQVASSLVAALGGPEQRIIGNLTICGSCSSPHNGGTEMCGLIEAQQHLITGVHTAVSRARSTL
ncbi:hypothetical protein AB0F96_37310 [Streptomyces sp. NPDC023998]|uniref:hypothetical protein n=1 Tax=Streptomyces sp. NPDC023998 TaxID=3154597 RepID=UPI0033E9957A